jgi:hypothetical protein
VTTERIQIVAKHAKPSVTGTLSQNGARGAAALAMASFGFLATAPTALAGGGDGDYGHDHKRHGDVHHQEWKEIDSHESEGIINVADNDVLVPIQVCNNYVPINVLGVQVPIEDVAGNIPILSEGDNDAEVGDETCQQPSLIGEVGDTEGFGKTAGGAPGVTDAGDEGRAGDSLDVRDRVQEHSLPPADVLPAEGAGRSLGAVPSLTPQQLVPAEAGDAAGAFGLEGTPEVANVEGFGLSGF